MPRLSELNGQGSGTVKLSSLGTTDPRYVQEIPSPENFLQKAIKAAGVVSHDAASARDAFVNASGFGLPKMIDKALDAVMPLPDGGQLYQEPETLPGKLANGAAAFAGFVGGGPGNLSANAGEAVTKAAGKYVPRFIAKNFGRAAEGAAAGALTSSDNDFFDVGKRAENAKTGAMAGPIVGAAFDGIQKIAKPIAGRLMNSVLKDDAKLGYEAASEGLSGTKKQIKQKSEDLIQRGENQLQRIIKGRKQKVNVFDIASSLDDVLRPFENIGDHDSVRAIQEVQDMLLDKSPDGLISLEDANQLKRDLYYRLRSSQFGTSEIPAAATARKQAAYGLKKEIEGALPGEGIGEVNKRIQTGIQSRDAIEKRINQEGRNVILPFFETATGAAGLAAHRPEIVAALVARRLFGSTPAKSGLASFLANVSRQSSRGISSAASYLASRN